MAIAVSLSLPVVAAIAAIALAPVIVFASQLVQKRRLVRRMKALGKPTPPHSFFLGHLLEIKKAFDALPPGAHSQYAIAQSGGQALIDRGAFYFDSWPFFDPLLIVLDPAMADQVVSHPFTGATKPACLSKWLRDITGGPSIFDANGAAWEHLHAVVSPSFNAASIAAQMPTVMENVQLFKEILKSKAGAREVFELEALCKRLVIDNNGNLLMSTRLNVQTRAHPLAEAMIETLRIKDPGHKVDGVWAAVSPMAHYAKWSNDRTLNAQIREFLLRRFRELKADKDAGAASGAGFRSVMDRILDDYLGAHPAAAVPDEDFIAAATRNLRTFFFVGYDSTAAAIVSALLLLAQNPAALARLRAEHDAVLGANPAAAPDAISASPALLNSLPYTLAVVRETLRIYPPANGIREGSRDLVLRNPRTGEEFPTEGFALQIMHWDIHNSPRHWVRGREFLPERWLVGPEHELAPRKGAWRAFEFGTRTCVGQQLVLTGLKAVLACIVREFDFEPCYDEVGLGKVRNGKEMDLTGVGGHSVYLVEAGAAHPLGGFPCRVTVR